MTDEEQEMHSNLPYVPEKYEPLACPVERGVISPPSLMAMITSLMGKANRVTSQHRHGLKVSDSALTRLSNKQIELEELMEELGL